MNGVDGPCKELIDNGFILNCMFSFSSSCYSWFALPHHFQCVMLTLRQQAIAVCHVAAALNYLFLRAQVAYCGQCMPTAVFEKVP